MRPRIVVCCVIAGALLHGLPRNEKLDQIVESARTAFAVPAVAVAIVHGDEVIWAKGYGARDAGQDSPVTADTRFAIGSLTKAFTTAAIGILVSEGKMNWDDPVKRHLPWFRLADPLADANVTLRDLLCHRTGLSRHDLLWNGSPWSREEIVRKVGSVPLSKPFRSAYQYQNIMFVAAGQAVAAASGSSWEQFVKSRIFDPLGMRNSDFSVEDARTAPNVAFPHARRRGTVERISWVNIDNSGPAGSINSSVNDLARWVRMLLGGGSFQGKQILRPETVREMHTPQMIMRLDDPTNRSPKVGTHMMAYGLGWIVQDYRGHHLVSHSGAVPGFRSHIALLPEHGYGIIILSNLDRVSLPESLRSELIDELLHLEPIGWTQLYRAAAATVEEETKNQQVAQDSKRFKESRPSRDLPAYVGDYENAAYGRATISVDGSTLMFGWSRWKVRLEHLHFNTFYGILSERSPERQFIEFRLNIQGEPDAMTFVGQEFRRVVVKTTPPVQ